MLYILPIFFGPDGFKSKPSTPSLPSGPVNCSLTARQTNTSSTLASRPEHWCISTTGHMLETAIQKRAQEEGCG
jgi:hypothetical protein